MSLSIYLSVLTMVYHLMFQHDYTENYDMTLKAVVDYVLMIWWGLCFWEQIIYNVNIPRLSINHVNQKVSVFDYVIFFFYFSNVKKNYPWQFSEKNFSDAENGRNDKV